jgi:hypothetical protein
MVFDCDVGRRPRLGCPLRTRRVPRSLHASVVFGSTDAGRQPGGRDAIDQHRPNPILVIRTASVCVTLELPPLLTQLQFAEQDRVTD